MDDSVLESPYVLGRDYNAQRETNIIKQNEEPQSRCGFLCSCLSASLSYMWQKALVSWLIFAFISVLSTEVLIRKSTTTIYMRNYRTLLNILIIAACTLVFWVIFLINYFLAKRRSASTGLDASLLLESSGSGVGVDPNVSLASPPGLSVHASLINRLSLLPSLYHAKWFAFLAFLDCVGVCMVILSVTYISAPAATLLTHAVLPFSFLLNLLVFQRQSSSANTSTGAVPTSAFHRVHYIGSVFIVASLLLTIITARDEASMNDAIASSTSCWWSFVFVLANLPFALGGIFKQKILSHSNLHKRAQQHQLNAYVALFQLLFSLALAPICLVLQDLDRPYRISPGHIFTNFADGWDCFIYGKNSIYASLLGQTICPLCDKCSAKGEPSALPFAVIHIACVVLLNLLALAIIKQRAGIVFTVAGAISIPAVALVSALPQLGSLQVTLNVWELSSMLLMLLGLVLYRSKPEIASPGANGSGGATNEMLSFVGAGTPSSPSLFRDDSMMIAHKRGDPEQDLFYTLGLNSSLNNSVR